MKTPFTPCCSVSIVHFEHVITGWDLHLQEVYWFLLMNWRDNVTGTNQGETEWIYFAFGGKFASWRVIIGASVTLLWEILATVNRGGIPITILLGLYPLILIDVIICVGFTVVSAEIEDTWNYIP